MAEGFRRERWIGIPWFGGLSSGVVDRSLKWWRAITLNQSLGIAFSVGKVGRIAYAPRVLSAEPCTPRKVHSMERMLPRTASEYSSNNRLRITRSSE